MHFEKIRGSYPRYGYCAKSYIRPVLEYASPVWHSSITQTQSKKGNRKVEEPDENLPVIEASVDTINDISKGPEESSDNLINNGPDGAHDDFGTAHVHEEGNVIAWGNILRLATPVTM